MLDCYNNDVISGIAVSVTTRVNSCNHYFFVEIYETDIAAGRR